jgi:hypothetical protein
MKLFLDFDGVVNFDASRSKYNRNRDGLGYLRRDTLYSRHGSFSVNYSSELVKKLNDLHSLYGFDWKWLTTWVNEAVVLVDPRVGTHSDGFVDWDPETGITRDNLVTARAKRKYAALKANYNGEPFIWVDDEATVEFVASDFDVPTLVIAPDPLYGITKTDLTRISDFLAAHAGGN